MPESNDKIIATRGENPGLTPGNGLHRTVSGRDEIKSVSGGKLPDFNRLVFTTRGKILAIGTECDRPNVTIMGVNGLERLQFRHSPQS
jgi:hypothetical protein